jgi:NitT/TauT family transport system ATP-binding protein
VRGLEIAEKGQKSGAAPALEAASREPVLTLESVAKSYAGRAIIKKASLAIRPGEALALSGPSGVGKSTLLEIMAGVVKPDSGRVKRGGQASLMFQDDCLAPWLSSIGNLLFAADSALEAKAAESEARKWLGYFELDGDVFPAALSGGMRRRLNLARALMAGRPILLLDEPFAFLDAVWREKVALLIAKEVKRGAAVALSDHGNEEVLRFALGRSLHLTEVKGPPVELALNL